MFMSSNSLNSTRYDKYLPLFNGDNHYSQNDKRGRFIFDTLYDLWKSFESPFVFNFGLIKTNTGVIDLPERLLEILA